MEDGSQEIEVFCMEVAIQRIRVRPSISLRWEDCLWDREALPTCHELVERNISSDDNGRVWILAGPDCVVICNGVKHGESNSGRTAVRLHQNDVLAFDVRGSFTEDNRNHPDRVVAVVEYAGVPGMDTKIRSPDLAKSSDERVGATSKQHHVGDLPEFQDTNSQETSEDQPFDLGGDCDGISVAPALLPVEPSLV